MKSLIGFVAVVCLGGSLVSSAAFAGYTPVKGSCSAPGMGKGLCSCDLKSSIDGGVIHSDTVYCSALLCSDFKDAVKCGGMLTAVCELSNPTYAGECVQNVLFDPTLISSPLQACLGVQRELNTPLSFGHNYCNATSIRGGWKLDAAH